MRILLAGLCVAGCVFATAEGAAQGFGFGGAMAMAFFPDMSGVNIFMSENGLPSMDDVLFGAGGGGRGGIIGGPVLGGVGWGVLATSSSDVRQAELVFGGGGLDLGWAIGGNDRSVLTIGTVLGGGAHVLTLTERPVEAAGIGTSGIIVEPTRREIGRAVGFVQPYISMSAQFLSWVGFEFRAGYVLPVFGVDFGDLVGIPAPSLEFSGPTVSLGFVFGGIGSGKVDSTCETADPTSVTALSEGAFAIGAGEELAIENLVGDIRVTGYAPDSTQTGSGLVVEWQIFRTAHADRLEELQATWDRGDAGYTVTSTGTGRIDYILRVPYGIDLKLKTGTGDITLLSHEAQTIILEDGVGDVRLDGVSALALIVAGGIGGIDLGDADARTLIANLGVGSLDLSLPVGVSAKLHARAGIGEVEIERFPAMVGGVRGFLGQTADVTLGGGADSIQIEVGIGKVDIGMRLP